MKLPGLVAALLAFAFAPGALAQTQTYDISGTFTAPATGSFSGSYVVDTVPNTIVSADIQVTAGKARDGTTDLPANVYTFAGGQDASGFGFATGVPASGLRGGRVAVNGTKAAPVSIRTFVDSRCASANCGVSSSDAAINRSANTGTVALAVAAVPSLSEWTMILFGLILAGGAALYIQRRQMATRSV